MTRIETEYGPIHVHENDRIGNLFLRGFHYEKGTALELLEHCTNKRTAVDVGANVGSHTIIYQNVFENVVAIEPQKHLADLLELSVKENVQVISKAVGHKLGTCLIHDKTQDGPVSYGSRGIGGSGSELEMITIDSLDLQDVDLIKIDTEGSEFLIIYGARETIKKYHPVIMYETIGEGVFKQNMKEFCGGQLRFDILTFLKSEGYNTFFDVGKNKICLKQ